MRGLALALIVVGVLGFCWRWGSYVAGGSDSYCYVHQAERWASGRLQVSEPLALEAPWPNAALAFAPAGHLPSPTVPGAIVPICPSGLSMAMAPFVLVAGPRAAFLAVPIFGALLLVAIFVVGSRFGQSVGLASAALTSSSPIFLYQVIQPMSDVPAAAMWAWAVALATGTRPRDALLAGLATSTAILLRPNLVPLGIVIGLFLLCRPERTWAERLRAASRYAAACVPGCLVVLWVQQTYYGSPWASGYGDLTVLFSLDHVAPNASRYAWWLWQSHTPAILGAALALWVLPGPLSSLLVSLFAVNLALYLPYVVFEDWSYLRFLLPTIPFLLVLVAGTVGSVWRRARLPHPHIGLVVVSLVLAGVLLTRVRDHDTLRLRAIESRFERAGTFVAESLPARALVITRWQSGSVRFYAGRKTLLWDGLPPESLDQAVAFVQLRGYEPYLLLERWEEPAFRERFTGSALGALDWPPVAEVASQVRIYRPSDRRRYFGGTPIATEYVR